MITIKLKKIGRISEPLIKKKFDLLKKEEEPAK
jgi:hypothetical protein